MTDPSVVELVTCARVPTASGEFRLCLFRDRLDEKEHLAAVMGIVDGQEAVLVRLHSECFTGDVLGSLRCDCGEQLQHALEAISAEGSGVIVYLRQEGRGIGLAQKLRAYNLQDQGLDTVDANLALGHQADERHYGSAARILQHLGLRSIRLLTNNPHKIDSLRALGIEVVGRVPLQIDATRENEAYLETKRRRMNHWLPLDPNPTPPIRRPAREG